MPSPTPRVTCGMPVYNGEAYLRKALDNLLAQDYADLEIVISDNGSRDRTPDICREYCARDARIRYLRLDRSVPPIENFCRTLAAARGEYFTWTAVDDERPPGAIAACVAALDSSPEAVMAHGPIIADVVRHSTRVRIEHRMDLREADVGVRVRKYTEQLQYTGILYGLYRRLALQQATFKQHPGHDYVLPLQLCALGPVVYTSTPILIYRHVWGETDTPMYRLERPTLRDLLVYRGIRRRKCWITLLYAVYFLLRLPGLSPADRLRAAAVHSLAFIRRYPGHLGTELIFLLSTPAAWAFAPFVSPGRRIKRALIRRRTPA